MNWGFAKRKTASAMLWVISTTVWCSGWACSPKLMVKSLLQWMPEPSLGMFSEHVGSLVWRDALGHVMFQADLRMRLGSVSS